MIWKFALSISWLQEHYLLKDTSDDPGGLVRRGLTTLVYCASLTIFALLHMQASS